MSISDETIRKVARVLTAHPSIPNHKDAIRDVCPSCPEADVAGPNSPSHAAHQARALAEAGLLAPAPLREEWGSEMDHPIPDSPPSTIKARDLEQARWQIEHNPEVATGRIMHRYVSDWMPVNSDEGDRPVTARERVARSWHEGSDHAKDGTPFGGPLCNCLRVAERMLPMLREAWAAGQEAGINDDLGDWEVAPSITHNPYEPEEDS